MQNVQIWILAAQSVEHIHMLTLLPSAFLSFHFNLFLSEFNQELLQVSVDLTEL